MHGRSYELRFDGYWGSSRVSGLPATSGIYCVYACTHHPQRNTVSIGRLLYIGEAGNVQEQVPNHERWQDWDRELNVGETLCFSVAPVTFWFDRKRAEAAMIYWHKPPCNVDSVDSFPYDLTTISTVGQNANLSSGFTAQRTVSPTTGAILGTAPRW